jgi:hypothetical protein
MIGKRQCIRMLWTAQVVLGHTHGCSIIGSLRIQGWVLKSLSNMLVNILTSQNGQKGVLSMPKNKKVLRIDMTNDVNVVLHLLVEHAIAVNFNGKPDSSWFIGADLVNDPMYGKLLKDEEGHTLNSNATRILDHATAAGILIDLGPKTAHGGSKPSIYTLNPAFWDLYIDSHQMSNMQIFTFVKEWYNRVASFRNRLPSLDRRYQLIGVHTKRRKSNGARRPFDIV